MPEARSICVSLCDCRAVLIGITYTCVTVFASTVVFTLMKRANTGFTLVELVTVILLLSILVISASSLFSNKQNYDALAIKDTVISLARYAQQVSMARGQATLTITRDASNSLIMEVSSNGTLLRRIPDGSTSQPYNIDTLVLKAAQGDSTCAVATSLTSVGLTLTFNSLGELKQPSVSLLHPNTVNGADIDQTQGAILCMGSDQVSVSAAGYAQ